MLIIEVTKQEAAIAIIAAHNRHRWGPYSTRLHVAKHGAGCMALYRIVRQIMAIGDDWDEVSYRNESLILKGE